MKLFFISLLLLPLISASENEEVPTSSVTDPDTSNTVSQPIDIPLREYNVSFHKSPAVNGTDRFAFFWAGEKYGDNTLPDNFTGTTFLNPEGVPHSWTYEEIVKMKEMKEDMK